MKYIHGTPNTTVKGFYSPRSPLQTLNSNVMEFIDKNCITRLKNTLRDAQALHIKVEIFHIKTFSKEDLSLFLPLT